MFEDGVVIRLDLADLGVDGSVLVTRCGPCIGTLRIIVPWVELYASKGIDQGVEGIVDGLMAPDEFGTRGAIHVDGREDHDVYF